MRGSFRMNENDRVQEKPLREYYCKEERLMTSKEPVL